MHKSSFGFRWMLCAIFLLLTSFSGPARAQESVPTYSSLVRQIKHPAELLDLFKPPSLPPRLYRLEGPDTLKAGEDGLFAALANVETATLPLRAQWDFGDGTTASSLHVRHRYTVPGTYTVTFRLTNRHGEATDRLVVTVVPAGAQAVSAAR